MTVATRGQLVGLGEGFGKGFEKRTGNEEHEAGAVDDCSSHCVYQVASCSAVRNRMAL
jgi:hypothetical protein